MHERAGTRWVRSLVIVTLLLGAAACNGDPPPPGAVKTSTPTVTSSTPTPTPTPTPVDQQIEATMRAYFEAANKAFRTGGVDNLKALTAPTCPCRSLVRRIQQVVSDGGHYEGARYDVKDLKVHDVIADSAAVEIRASVPSYRVLDSDGNISQHSQGGQLHTDFSLIQREGKWIITNSFDLG